MLVEHRDGSVSDITFELLGLGREVAEALSGSLTAIVLGCEGCQLTKELGAADEVLSLDHPALRHPSPYAWAQALEPLLREREPRLMLIGLTNATWGIGPFLSARLQWPYVNFCRALRVEDGRVVATAVLYGGKMDAEVEVPDHPTVVGVMPGASPADKGRREGTPRVQEIPSALPEDVGKVEFLRVIQPETGDIDLTTQDVLVAVGRGIQSQDNIALAEELAQALGGAVAASRPVVDQGWLPLSRQVGRSGAIVKPRLYLALGISGAPEHVEGMRDSQVIVAVNTDPTAPIFSVAHYGVVADAIEFMEALTEAVKHRKEPA
ncbi:MAG: electron transfer flavoprotein subunit alpha/FixB family protein [Anaerolineae bacterium]